MCICTYIDMYIWIYGYMFICIYVCMHICIYLYTYILCIYIYMCIHTLYRTALHTHNKEHRELLKSLVAQRPQAIALATQRSRFTQRPGRCLRQTPMRRVVERCRRFRRGRVDQSAVSRKNSFGSRNFECSQMIHVWYNYLHLGYIYIYMG